MNKKNRNMNMYQCTATFILKRYLCDILLFHPRWKGYAIAEHLKQCRSQCTVVVSTNSANVPNIMYPVDFSIGLKTDHGDHKDKQMAMHLKLY